MTPHDGVSSIRNPIAASVRPILGKDVNRYDTRRGAKGFKIGRKKRKYCKRLLIKEMEAVA